MSPGRCQAAREGSYFRELFQPSRNNICWVSPGAPCVNRCSRESVKYYPAGTPTSAGIPLFLNLSGMSGEEAGGSQDVARPGLVRGRGSGPPCPVRPTGRERVASGGKPRGWHALDSGSGQRRNSPSPSRQEPPLMESFDGPRGEAVLRVLCVVPSPPAGCALERRPQSQTVGQGGP